MDQSGSFPLSGALEGDLRELGGHWRADEADTFFESEIGKGGWRLEKTRLRSWDLSLLRSRSVREKSGYAGE